MKKCFLSFLIMLVASTWIIAQTAGTLTVTTTTSSAGGNYSPKNIVAIWIEDEQGNFVKTLLAYAQTRKTHLNTWEASTTAAGSPFNTVDAVTGATKSSHDTRTGSWNGTDISGTLVPDGLYRIRMELTDKNSTGNFSTFTFIKDADPENLNPANVPSFSSISINWEPVITSIGDISGKESIKVYPNPSAGLINITGENIEEIYVRDVTGALIFRGTSAVIDLGQQPDGIYYLEVKTRQGTVTKTIVKRR